MASSKQTEVFERSDAKILLGLDLGTNTARIAVPVTYRYHICLYDPWRMHIGGSTLVVCAPAVRCGIPPAIHTDEIQQAAVRGWARGTPNELLEKLHHDLTPTLSQYANDSRRMEMAREMCRRSVAEFVKRWLEGENRWRPEKFTAINVHFANEPAVPARPTIQLLSFKQQSS